MKPLLLILGLFPFFSIAQSEGIKFEDNLSWSGLLAKAKAERRYIFVDCYTTWCAPCKYMSQKIFTQRPVGEFFNTNFINVSVQMDRTLKDPERIRKWYAEADSINAKYGISAYPTYLFFSPTGEVLHRFIGSFEATEFLSKAADALVPEKQYYTLINHYKEHLGDSIFLRNALIMAEQTGDGAAAENIAEEYFASLRDSFSVSNINLFLRVKMRCAGKVFGFFLANSSKIDNILGRKDPLVENALCLHIRSEQLIPLFDAKDAILNYDSVLHRFQNTYPPLANLLPSWVSACFKHFIGRSINTVIYEKGSLEPDWEAVTHEICIHYPGYDCSRLVREIEPAYYRSKRMWPQCEKAALSFLSSYGKKLNADEINSIVWDYFFMLSSNPKILQIALKWSKHSLEMNPTGYEYMDTYANLLYKIGARQEALRWEKKALAGSANAEIRANFEKMKNYIKTWEK